jgi:uncharacterized Zn finger protein
MALRQLADAKSFVRGEEYLADGRVLTVEECSGRIVATVQGSDSYSVELWQEGDQLSYDCSCPRGADGDFCKHCVAVGLAVLAGPIPQAGSHRGCRREISLDDIQSYLKSETKDVLVNLLMARATEDASLLDQLRLRAAKQHDRGRVNIEAFKAVLRRGLTPAGFVDWRAASHFVAEVDHLVDSLEELIGEGDAAAGMELVEYALQLAEQAMESVDDSGGDMGALLERLQALHHQAAKRAKPDAIELARRLFDWELRSSFDVFYEAAARYADVLGTQGVAEYHRLAKERWEKVPALLPGQNRHDELSGRFKLTSIMRTVAQQAGDFEAEVEVMKRDLSVAYHFLEIATVYRQAGQDGLALAWAEKGIAAFPSRTDKRLREFLADEYHRRKRHDDAIALAWASLSEQPSLQEYQWLKTNADYNRSWPSWREKALSSIRERIAKDRSTSAKNGWSPTFDHSLLVEIFLFEKNSEAAWQEALTGGCSRALRLKLAEQRARTHPEDALPIYKRELESTLSQVNNAAYETGVGLLKRIHGVLSQMGQGATFAPYLATVRSAHARKRNFVRLLEETRWER